MILKRRYRVLLAVRVVLWSACLIYIPMTRVRFPMFQKEVKPWSSTDNFQNKISQFYILAFWLVENFWGSQSKQTKGSGLVCIKKLLKSPWFDSRSFRQSSWRFARPRREEEAHAANIFWAANLRSREDLWTDKVLGGARACEIGLRTRHDRLAS